MWVDDASDRLVHEKSVDGLGRGEEAPGSWCELEVLVREEVEDGKRQRVDTVLCVVGHLDVGKSMLEMVK